MGISSRLFRKRDFYAGLLIMAFGLLFALKGPSYNVGTLMHMGPGFLPTALGVLLVGLGIAIAMTAIPVPDGEDEDILPAKPEWFAWACILASPVAFIIFGSMGTMRPLRVLAILPTWLITSSSCTGPTSTSGILFSCQS